jgi:hypothetical protein
MGAHGEDAGASARVLHHILVGVFKHFSVVEVLGDLPAEPRTEHQLIRYVEGNIKDDYDY